MRQLCGSHFPREKGQSDLLAGMLVAESEQDSCPARSRVPRATVDAEFPARAVTAPRGRYDGGYVPPRCCPGPVVRLGLASTSDLTLPSVR
jgi:hypothetical protein